MVWQMYFKIIIWDLNHNLQISKCIKVVCYWISLIIVSIVLKHVWTVLYTKLHGYCIDPRDSQTCI